MSSTRETVRLATRSSDLARRQAATVKEALATRRRDVELVEVSTTGDDVRDELIHELGTTGAFVRSLDQEVLDGDADAAVHSMKDMPTEMPEDMVVAGIPERAPAGDLLVTPDGKSLDELPEGATVGTASLRRGAQVRRQRPDLEIAGLRGNVDTRVEKLLAPGLQREHEARLDDAEKGTEEEDDAFEQSVEEWFEGLREIERRALEREVETEYDAIVLAAAGLERSGLRHQVGTHELPTSEFVPSAGQGAIAVTMLDGDLARDVQDTLDHPPTRVATMTERAILAELGAGCVAPIGIHAVLQGEYVTARVQVLDREGEDVVADSRDLPATRYASAAREFAADLADRGAADIVERARREETDEAKRGE